MANGQPRATLFRFGLVAIAGLLLDVTIAWCAASIFGVQLTIAAVMGLICGAVLNYFLHENWTFRAPRGVFSLRRFSLYVVSLATVVSVRALAVSALEPALSSLPESKALVLVFAAGFSFVANFLASRYLVFR